MIPNIVVQRQKCVASDSVGIKHLDMMFKKACPDAYSFSYDDAASTFTCVGKPLTNYDIVFCG